MTHDPEHNHPDGAGYEVDDANIREILITGVGLAVGTVLVAVAVLGLIRLLTAADPISSRPMTQIPTSQTFPPGPRVQERPWEELEVLRKREDQALTTYGWVNKDAGTVRLPIDRAMDMVVERGLPVHTGTEGGAASAKTNVQPNVPPQATGYPPRASGGKSNAAQK